MALTPKAFNEIVTFSRASGATRVNAAGLIVGVDFSSTSVTFGTGSQTFTLAADLGVNRDWVVGSLVSAVSQAAPLGTMTGTVLSYDSATQELVIDVATSTGTGAATNWRIGSLESRIDYDPVTGEKKGLLVEGQASNLRFPSSPSTLNATDGTSTGVANTSVVTPDGSISGVVMSPANEARFALYYNYVVQSGVAGTTVESVFCKPDINLLENGFFGKSTSSGNPRFFRYTFSTDTLVGNFASKTKVEKLSGGWYRFSTSFQDNGANSVREDWIAGTTNNTASSVILWGNQRESSPAPTSYIPTTTTVAVTRAADLAAVDGARFDQAINPAQGTLVIEATPTDGVTNATVASINDGTDDNRILVAQKQTGTRSSIRAIASDGVTDVMALNATGNNLIRSNGVDLVEVAAPQFIGSVFVASDSTSKFLVGGSNERFNSTQDSGLSYDSRGVSGLLAGAHFGIGRFVIASAAGDTSPALGSVIVSTDGLAFRRVNIAGLTQSLTEVTSNGVDQYVAVGGAGVIYTSPDAEVWTAQTSGAGAAAFGGIHFFGGRYVAVTSNSQNTRYSDDGITWSATSGLTANMFDVYHNSTDLWVAVGSGGAIYSSADGITWTQQTSPVSTLLLGIHFADGLWVAVGNAGTVVTSPDGVTWTDRTATSGTTNQLTEVGFFDGNFYVCTGPNFVLKNSAANIVANVTWTQLSSDVSSTLQGIATNGSRLLICGSGGAIATSEDGTTFTSRTGNNATLNGAAFGNGTYVVVGNVANGSGLIATVDPVTFDYQRRVSGTTQIPIDVVFGAGRFVAFGGNTRVTHSTDAISWTTIGGPIGQNARGVGFGDGKFVFVGESASVGNFFTYDSQIITVLGSGLIAVNAAAANDVDFANDIFVIACNSGQIYTSTTGTGNWTLRTSGTTANLYAVHYSTRDQQWYAAGDSGTILRSPDAITWESIANDAIGAVVSGGNVQANPFLSNLTPGSVNKVAMRFAANDIAVSVNGEDAVTDTSATIPATDRLTLGELNGHIGRLTYYPTLKTDEQLKELSA